LMLILSYKLRIQRFTFQKSY